MMRRRTAKSQGGVSENYSFDAIDQVTGANYGGARNVSYNYDSVGNRTSVVDNAVTTNYSTNNLNQYTSVAGVAHGSDTNGNLVSGQGIFLYDSYNRLTQAVVGANTVLFSYDCMSRVVKRTSNGIPLFLIYDGWSLIEERDASGTVLQKYVNGVHIDEILLKSNAFGSVYYHQDALGSVTQLTDSSGNIVEKYTYDIFGKASTFGGLNLQPIASSLHANRFLFTGRECLFELGLYDYRNRVYSCELGRFLQTDPIRFKAGDVNLYRYCGNDITDRIDPLGLLDYHHQGNYGGPGYTNGGWEKDQFPDRNPKPEDIGPPKGPPPVNAEDACYMEHDRCFARCKHGKCKGDPAKLEKCKARCNVELIKCLKKTKLSPTNAMAQEFFGTFGSGDPRPPKTTPPWQGRAN
jgi:RHS repeat-associated protein